ncbi:MAG: DUF1592 domain-containing protein, partial [Archangium sp.]|nr:DUF1592 domain-containing protein [Archangium sp.]
MRHIVMSSCLALCACDGGILSVLPLERAPVKGPGGGVVPGATSVDPSATPIRRLSAVEYQRSLARLFPGAMLPVVTLPADTKPHGFDNDAAANGPSALLVDAWLQAAQDVSASVTRAGAPYTCAANNAACPEQKLRDVLRRAWRRPPTDEDVADFMTIGATGPASTDARARVQLLLEAVLLTPDFLYRFDVPAVDPGDAPSATIDAYSLASRLSYLVTAAGPDDELLDAARDGKLDTDEGLQAELERLLAQPESRDGVLHFFRQWFEVERLETVRKLEADGFDATMRASLAESFDRYVESIVFDGQGGTVNDLLTQPYAFVDATTAPIYGLTGTSEWQRVQLDPLKRAGVLTQPLFLSTHAHPGNPSPVLRGVFVLEKVLCQRVGSPPAAAQGVAITATGPGPSTNRSRYEATTTAGTCGGCHSTFINPPGYAFEHYDTLGRRLELDGAQPIDASGTLLDFHFTDGLDFSKQLGASAMVRRCVTERFAR